MSLLNQGGSEPEKFGNHYSIASTLQRIFFRCISLNCIMATVYVFSRFGNLRVTSRRDLDWMIGYTDILYRQPWITGNIALSLIYTRVTVHRSTRTRILSSLVVSWQRIYNSLIEISNHT
jgi:hypothetical protein